MFILRMYVHFSSSLELTVRPKINTTVLYCVEPLNPQPHLNAPWGLEGLIIYCLDYVHSKMNQHTCFKFGHDRSSRSAYFPIC